MAAVKKNLWLCFAVVFAAIAISLVSVKPALAYDLQYFSSWGQLPSAGVSWFDCRLNNLTVSHSSDVTQKGPGANGDGYGYSWYVSENYSGSGWVKAVWSNGARDVNGRWIDVTVLVNNIRKVGGYTPDYEGFFNIYSSSPTGAVRMAFGDWWNGTNAPCYTSFDVTVTLNYVDNGALVPYGSALMFSDLDISMADSQGHATPEAIILRSGFSNPIYLSDMSTANYSGTGLDIDDAKNGYLHGTHGQCTSNEEGGLHCGFMTVSTNGQFKFSWQGRKCGTSFRFRTLGYPYDFIGTPSKVGDDTVHFDGEKMTFKVNAAFPWAWVSYPAQKFEIVDTLDAGLDAANAQVTVKQDGSNVTNQWSVSKSGQTIRARWVGSGVPQGSYEFTIAAPVKANFNFSAYSKTSLTGGGQAYLVPNKASVEVVNYDGGLAVNKSTNTVNGRVSWTWVEVTVSSANDSVSQLGQNGCYNLKGAQVGIYSDAACTKRVTTLTLDANGYAKSDRLPLGTYYAGEIKQPNGFAENTVVDTVPTKGLLTSSDFRENVPQSEDLEGSLMSKYDAELKDGSNHKNPMLEALKTVLETLLAE